MTSRALLAVCLVGLVSLAGCRQPDGPLPVETAEDPNRLADLTRDLLNLAGGDRNAPREFADDMKVWGTSSDAPWPPADNLAASLGEALRGKNLTEQAAGQLSRHIWIATAGRELSNRQVERLQEEIKTLLASIGVTEMAAAAVAERVGEVQAAVNTKRRWWFQIF